MPNLVALLLILAVAAAVLNIGFVAAAFYALVAIALGTRWWIDRVERTLTYRREFDHRLFHGEVSHVRVSIMHGAPVPLPWLVVRDRLPLRLGYPQPFSASVAVPRGVGARLHYDVRGARRGVYPLGPVQLSFGDLLGLQDRLVRERRVDFIVVYPKIVSLRATSLRSKTALGAVRSPEPWNEDPARVVGTRDYRPGDSIRRMHWPVSARVGTLQVKQLEPAMTIETVVALNLNEGEFDLASLDVGTELGIVAAASLAQRLVQLRQSFALLSNGLDPRTDEAYDPTDPEARPRENGRPIWVPMGNGDGHLMRVLDVLARVERGTAIPFVDLLQRHTLDLPWGATILVITGDEGEGVPEAVLRLRRRGFHVAVLLVAAQRGYRPRRTRLEGIGVRVWRAWREEDLDAAFS